MNETAVIFSWAGMRRGMRDLLSAVPVVLAFGIGFGAAAVAAGLPLAGALTMSGLVFAGSSQYAAVELWRTPLPLAIIALTTLAVNMRHLVLGATLHAWMQQLPPLQRHALIAFLSDVNWAATSEAYARGERDAGHLLGGGLLVWVAWVAGTLIGALAGATAVDVHRAGLDVIMPAFFACALVGLGSTRDEWTGWLCAGLSAWLASRYLPTHWATLAGVAVGLFYGWVNDDAD